MKKDKFTGLQCPACSVSELEHTSSDKLFCNSCNAEFNIANNIPVLLTDEAYKTYCEELSSEEGKKMVVEYESVPITHGLLKKITSIFRPPSVELHINPEMKNKGVNEVFTHNGEATSILNVGGGPHRYSAKEITLNIRPFHNVDIVADAHNIPYQSNTFDSVICNAVLEHVHDPEKVVKEMIRVLKPGGFLYAEVPYLFFFHGYPNDYKRYTLEGMKRLFRKLGKSEYGITIGPMSSFLLTGSVLLNMILPVNNNILRKLINGLYRWILFPFKYVDLVLNKNSAAHIIAAGFYVLGKKEKQT